MKSIGEQGHPSRWGGRQQIKKNYKKNEEITPDNPQQKKKKERKKERKRRRNLLSYANKNNELILGKTYRSTPRFGETYTTVTALCSFFKIVGPLSLGGDFFKSVIAQWCFILFLRHYYKKK